MRRAVIYNRCSGQPDLTQKYTGICVDMAYVLDYDVVGVFTDESNNTLGLAQAVRAIESGQADVFVSFNKTTISRNIAEFSEFQKKLVECGGTLHVFNPETFPDRV